MASTHSQSSAPRSMESLLPSLAQALRVTPDAVSQPSPALNTVCVPLDIDGFVLNEPVCNQGPIRVGPIVRPDYGGLQPSPTKIEHDILAPLDLTNSRPATANPRISTSGTSTSSVIRENRLGIYVHWSLPRFYRTGTSAAPGTATRPTGPNQASTPTYRNIPNRWLVVRTLQSHQPAAVNLPRLTAWVVESDRRQDGNQLRTSSVDIETVASPYVAYNTGDESKADIFTQQANVFIGSKTPIGGWIEAGNTVPRLPVTTMNSSNPLFADYQPHNSNVLSIIDDLSYTDASGKIAKLTAAVCNYTVIGWHADPEADDPLGSAGLKSNLGDRLAALFCTLANPALAGALEAVVPLRTVCHGSLYHVSFARDVRPPSPADSFAGLFNADVNVEPVSVGTTPLDSFLTYLEAHSSNEDSVFGTGATGVATDILAIAQSLTAVDDQYDSKVRAADLLYEKDFSPAVGGFSWSFDGKGKPGGPPAEPSAVSTDGTGLSDRDYLSQANDVQARLDAANRKLTFTAHEMFAVWWQFVSDAKQADPSRIVFYAARLSSLRADAQALQQLIGGPLSGLQGQITAITKGRLIFGGPPRKPKVLSRKTVKPSYYQRNDPTVCVAGGDSGWPASWFELLSVRFLAELYRRIPTGDPRLTEITALITPITDPVIRLAVGYLLLEAENRTGSPTPAPPASPIGFKDWSGQPWRPLFIEWEGLYYNIPFVKWAVSLLNSPISNNHSQVRYGVTSNLAADPTSQADTRHLSGRMLINPQPSLNLAALVGQVLDATPTTQLPANLKTDQQRTDFLTKVAGFKYMTSQLSGVTTALLTLAEGSHTQPNLSIPGQDRPVALQAALNAGAQIGLTAADLAIIGGETGLTPLGLKDLIDTSDARAAGGTAFKGVIHGQMTITKLNIVDKFGQVVCAIDPKPTNPPSTIHPCLSDQLCPTLIPGSSTLNTIKPLSPTTDPRLPTPDNSAGYPLCPFVQLQPGINQPTRLNAHYLVPGYNSAKTFTGWRPAADWEQPIVGWLLPNYADQGLQLFTAGGTFYLEISLGGPNGVLVSGGGTGTGGGSRGAWAPFDPPANPAEATVGLQLDQLVQQMTDSVHGAKYVTSLWDMISKSSDSLPYAPGSLAAYGAAVVGKPLALVNIGLSLELAEPVLRDQVITDGMVAGGVGGTSMGAAGDVEGGLVGYKFPYKIGDAERNFDGMLGYFDVDPTRDPATDPSTASSTATDWPNLHTYATQTDGQPGTNGDPRRPILPSNFPTLSPHYVDPASTTLKNGSYAAEIASRLQVKLVIVDPFVELHVYCPVVPIKEIKLDDWIVQQALRRMTAFFTLGPVLTTHDVPKAYDATRPLTADSWLAAQNAMKPDTAEVGINLPLSQSASRKGLWGWLQPYDVGAGQDNGTAGDGVAGVPSRYNRIEVGVDDGRIRRDTAPYTMVEGFLQLARSVDPSQSG